MKITKLTHACLVLTEGDATLVVDPGSFTELPEDVPGLAGVIVTHEHADHASPDHLRALREAHPGVQILGTEAVLEGVPEAGIEVAQPGQTRTLGPFEVTFGGGLHAQIHSSIPQVDNLTVLVNGAVYHPGDSLEPPAHEVQVLAAPVSGPWLKLGEVIDYVLASRAQHVVPIHEIHASEPGIAITYARLGAAAAEIGAQLLALKPGQSLPAL